VEQDRVGNARRRWRRKLSGQNPAVDERQGGHDLVSGRRRKNKLCIQNPAALGSPVRRRTIVQTGAESIHTRFKARRCAVLGCREAIVLRAITGWGKFQNGMLTIGANAPNVIKCTRRTGEESDDQQANEQLIDNAPKRHVSNDNRRCGTCAISSQTSITSSRTIIWRVAAFPSKVARLPAIFPSHQDTSGYSRTLDWADAISTLTTGGSRFPVRLKMLSRDSWVMERYINRVVTLYSPLAGSGMR